MFEQWQNQLSTHFSIHIPIIKYRMAVCSVLPEGGSCLVLTGGTGSAQKLGLWSQADLGLNLCLVPYQLCDHKQVAFNLFMP